MDRIPLLELHLLTLDIFDSCNINSYSYEIFRYYHYKILFHHLNYIIMIVYYTMDTNQMYLLKTFIKLGFAEEGEQIHYY